MVLKEAHEELRGNVEHAAPGQRPEGRAHRDQIVISKARRVAAFSQVLAQGHPSRTVRDRPGCHPVEPQDIANHAEMTRAKEIPLLDEELTDGGAVVLETSRVAPDAEAHVGGLRLDAQGAKQRTEQRVVGLVVHDEARVDTPFPSAVLLANRMDVTPDSVPSLEDDHFVSRMEQICRDQARDAASYDRDAHHSSLRPRDRIH